MTISVPRVVGAALSTSEIEVTVADGGRDIDDALAVIHDGFVEAGYLTPRPSGRRMHPSYLNPGTVFLVARIDGETVGTCAMVADGPFGLPSDRAFAEENDLMRAEGPVVRECGSLAVSGSHRRHTRRIVMRLFAAATRLALDEFPDSPVVVAVTPENERFYAAIAGAVRVADPRPLFGAPAVLLRTGGPLLALHCAPAGHPHPAHHGRADHRARPGVDRGPPAWRSAPRRLARTAPRRGRRHRRAGRAAPARRSRQPLRARPHRPARRAAGGRVAHAARP